MSQPIEEFDFTIRTYAVLKRSGVDTVEQIKAMNFAQITSLKNIHRKSVEEIEEKFGIVFQ